MSVLGKQFRKLWPIGYNLSSLVGSHSICLLIQDHFLPLSYLSPGTHELSAGPKYALILSFRALHMLFHQSEMLFSFVL